jgi:hypothetical protein
MKPDWDKLMAAYADHKSTLVADVDCTAEGKDLCGTVGIRGYPSIKYGDPSDLQDYKGGRDFASLNKFADELGPMCSPANLDACDEAKKNQINEFMALSDADMDKKISDGEAKSKKVSTDFDEFVKGLQKQYEEANKKKEADIEALKAEGLGLLKAVKAHKKKANAEL